MPDNPAGELSEEIWKAYWKRAPEIDKEFKKIVNQELDTLLLFVRVAFAE